MRRRLAVMAAAAAVLALMLVAPGAQGQTTTTTTTGPTTTTTPPTSTTQVTPTTAPPPLYLLEVTGTGCTATDQPYVEYTFTNQTGGDVIVAFSYSLDGAPYTDPLGRSAAGHGGTYTDRFEFSPGTEGTVTIRAVVEGDAPATVTADPVLLPACEPAPPPPPPPSCDCEGRQVTVTNASKYLLPGKELNQLGITCFNIRFLNFSGEYVVSASGPEAALKKLFDRD